MAGAVVMLVTGGSTLVGALFGAAVLPVAALAGLRADPMFRPVRGLPPDEGAAVIHAVRLGLPVEPRLATCVIEYGEAVDARVTRFAPAHAWTARFAPFVTVVSGALVVGGLVTSNVGQARIAGMWCAFGLGYWFLVPRQRARALDNARRAVALARADAGGDQ
jgi:hypothetical protein